MIEVKNLVFEYPGARVLHDVSFTLPSGSVTALVGPNGAGKTTLLRTLAALEEPFSGSMTVSGCDVVDHPRDVHARVGFLYDFYGLYNELSVHQSLSYRIASQGVPAPLHQERVELAIKRLGLNEVVRRRAAELSRGWRQKLAIALAIVHDPSVILLDEPAAGLDPDARMRLSDLFRELQADGKTLVVSSHILGELEDYSSHLLMIRNGRVSPLKDLHYQVAVKDDSDGQRIMMRVQVVEPVAEGAWDGLLDEIGATVVEAGLDHALFTMPATAQDRHRVLTVLMNKGLSVCAFEEHRRQLRDVYRDTLEAG